MKANDVNFNNEVFQMSKQERRFRYAMNEIKNLSSKNKKVPRPVGFIVRTHGYVFEWDFIGWILRPNGYLSRSEVAEHFPTEESRRQYYLHMNIKNRRLMFK